MKKYTSNLAFARLKTDNSTKRPFLFPSKFDTCELAKTVDLITKVQFYSKQGRIPTLIEKILQCPHGFNLRGYFQKQGNAVKNACKDEEGNLKGSLRTLDEDVFDDLERDNEGLVDGISEEDSLQIFSLLSKATLFYWAERSFDGSSLSDLHSCPSVGLGIYSTSLAMSKAFLDVLFQLMYGCNLGHHQVAVYTKFFTGIFSPAEVILTRILPSLEEEIAAYGIEYSYTSNVGKKDQTLSEKKEMSFKIIGELGLHILGTKVLYSIFIEGAAARKFFMFLTKKLTGGNIPPKGEGVGMGQTEAVSGYEAVQLIANFPFALASIGANKLRKGEMNNRFWSDDPETSTIIYDLQGIFLPQSFSLMIQAFQLLDSLNYRWGSSIFIGVDIYRQITECYNPSTHKGKKASIIWKLWDKHKEQRLENSHLKVWRKVFRFCPSYLVNLDVDAKEAKSEVTKLELCVPESELSEDWNLGPTTVVLCTSECAVRKGAVRKMPGFMKFTLNSIRSKDFTDLVHRNSGKHPEIKYDLRFYVSHYIRGDADALPSSNVISFSELVGPAWERYRQNFYCLPDADMFPFFRPSWLGQMKIYLLQRESLDNRVFIVWLGNNREPEKWETEYRMALHMSLTTQPIELLRSDRFASSAEDVERSLRAWVADLKDTKLQYIAGEYCGEIFTVQPRISIKVYGVITSEDTHCSEYLLEQIAAFRKLSELSVTEGLLTVETHLVTPGWVCECYHQAGLVYENRHLFDVDLVTSEISNEVESAGVHVKPLEVVQDRLNEQNASEGLESSQQPVNQAGILKLAYSDSLKIKNRPLWGWVIFIDASTYNRYDLDALRVIHGLRLISISATNEREIARHMESLLKSIIAPSKIIKFSECVKIFSLIVAGKDCSLKARKQRILNVKLKFGKVALPGYPGLPIVSVDWLDEVLKEGRLLDLEEFFLSPAQGKVALEMKDAISKDSEASIKQNTADAHSRIESSKIPSSPTTLATQPPQQVASETSSLPQEVAASMLQPLTPRKPTPSSMCLPNVGGISTRAMLQTRSGKPYANGESSKVSSSLDNERSSPTVCSSISSNCRIDFAAADGDATISSAPVESQEETLKEPHKKRKNPLLAEKDGTFLLKKRNPLVLPAKSGNKRSPNVVESSQGEQSSKKLSKKMGQASITEASCDDFSKNDEETPLLAKQYEQNSFSDEENFDLANEANQKPEKGGENLHPEAKFDAKSPQENTYSNPSKKDEKGGLHTLKESQAAGGRKAEKVGSHLQGERQAVLGRKGEKSSRAPLNNPLLPKKDDPKSHTQRDNPLLESKTEKHSNKPLENPLLSNKTEEHTRTPVYNPLLSARTEKHSRTPLHNSLLPTNNSDQHFLTDAVRTSIYPSSLLDSSAQLMSTRSSSNDIAHTHAGMETGVCDNERTVALSSGYTPNGRVDDAKIEKSLSTFSPTKQLQQAYATHAKALNSGSSKHCHETLQLMMNVIEGDMVGDSDSSSMSGSRVMVVVNSGLVTGSSFSSPVKISQSEEPSLPVPPPKRKRGRPSLRDKLALSRKLETAAPSKGKPVKIPRRVISIPRTHTLESPYNTRRMAARLASGDGGGMSGGGELSFGEKSGGGESAGLIMGDGVNDYLNDEVRGKVSTPINDEMNAIVKDKVSGGRR